MTRSLDGYRHTILAFDLGGEALTNRRVIAEIEPSPPNALRVDSCG